MIETVSIIRNFTHQENQRDGLPVVEAEPLERGPHGRDRRRLADVGQRAQQAALRGTAISRRKARPTRVMRAVAERALVRAGYTVTTASDGEEGLGIVANGDTQFDLIVSDVVMPAMDGPAMARAIRNVRAHVPILFMSGYAEEQLRNEIDIENMYFIPKPFSVQQINAKVAEVLSAQRK